MPMPLDDLTGKKFGRLTVVHRYGKSTCPVMWLCKCECGNEKPIARKHLLSSSTVSCGCYRTENNIRPRAHGQSCRASKGRTRLYITWEGIKQRCHNPKFHHYKDYGGRGITVCDRWKNSFENFFEDMGNKPKGKTLERIDNEKGYSKENCKWASMKEQSRNRRSTRMITYNGKTQTMTDWAREYGLSRGVLWQRIYNLKWDLKDALTMPVKSNKRM